MDTESVLKKGNVAVVTGAADGIGLAAAARFAEFGMQVCMVDVNQKALDSAADGVNPAMSVAADVADIDAMRSLKDRVIAELGQVNVLMNNAGTGGGNNCWTDYEVWQKTLNTNLWGVINGVQAFTEAMLDNRSPGLIINTGSKQGITAPPGNPAYNVSKAGVKSFTEALAHSLRTLEGCQLSAHLLVPGFTYTGMIRAFLPEQPAAAWSADQVVSFMLERIEAGDFYILCPDNDVDRALDNKRMEWAMGDLIHNRPALSRWHPEFADEYNAFEQS